MPCRHGAVEPSLDPVAALTAAISESTCTSMSAWKKSEVPSSKDTQCLPRSGSCSYSNKTVVKRCGPLVPIACYCLPHDINYAESAARFFPHSIAQQDVWPNLPNLWPHVRRNTTKLLITESMSVKTRRGLCHRASCEWFLYTEVKHVSGRVL